MHYVLANPWQFAGRVVSGFRANQGFLLSGAVAYYTLLSIIPMLVLILVILSQIQEPQMLLDTLHQYLTLMMPGQVEPLIGQVQVFLINWKIIGVMGVVILLFFSSFAFTALENAMSVIFFHRVNIKRRHFLVSAIIPYVYICLLGVGLFIVSVVSGSLHSMAIEDVILFGHSWSLTYVESGIVYLFGIGGEVLLLTSLYLVMPVGRLSVRHALIGGITAAVLWEITRHILIWYFSTLSFVNVVYGVFATAIIVLISLEAATLILLLGAQVIAEYERLDHKREILHGLQT